jgi:hypothetical protein
MRVAVTAMQFRRNGLICALRLAPALLVLWSAIGANVRAQDLPTPSPPTPVAEDPAPTGGDKSAHEFPVDVAGYVGFRNLISPGQMDSHSEYSSSIFVSKTLKRFRFHSEFNVANAGQYDGEGINLFHSSTDWKAKLDSATVTYTFRDWLQVGAGFEFVPTYWRTHRYQSTTLTVEDPIIDQRVFPTAFKGAMLKGDRYFARRRTQPRPVTSFMTQQPNVRLPRKMT